MSDKPVLPPPNVVLLGEALHPLWLKLTVTTHPLLRLSCTSPRSSFMASILDAMNDEQGV